MSKVCITIFEVEGVSGDVPIGIGVPGVPDGVGEGPWFGIGDSDVTGIGDSTILIASVIAIGLSSADSTSMDCGSDDVPLTSVMDVVACSCCIEDMLGLGFRVSEEVVVTIWLLSSTSIETTMICVSSIASSGASVKFCSGGGGGAGGSSGVSCT